MATTKKSTKGRKKSRKYMKRAARRTLAALLMITALIVAAIPATPGRAADTPDYSGGYQYAISQNGCWLYLSDAQQIDLGDNKKSLRLIAVSRIDDSSKEDIEISLNRDFDIPNTSVSHCYITEIGPEFVSKYGSSRSISEDLVGFFGYDVQVVEDKAFQNCSRMGNCQLGDLNWIGGHAFENTAITSTPLGDNSHLTFLGNNAFSGSKLNGEIIIPGPDSDQPASLGDEVFSNCSQLGSAKFTGNFNSIGNSTFENCMNFSGVSEWPSGLKSIGNNTFKSCSGNAFVSIRLPDTITSIGSGTFLNCAKLNTIRVPNWISSLPSNTFAGCQELVDVNIPGRVGNIPKDFFKDSPNLTFVHLSNSDEGAGSPDDDFFQNISIENGAFPKSASENGSPFTVYGYRYYDITGQGKRIPSVYSNAYKYCIDNNIRYFCIKNSNEDPDGFADEFYDIDNDGKIVNILADKAAENNVLMIHQTITDDSGKEITVRAISGNAISNGSSLVGIVLPETVEKIYPEAFSGLGALQYVQFSNPNKTAVVDTGDNVFPKNSGFYIRGHIAINTAGDGNLNSYEYASKYGIEFRGSVTNEGVTNTLVIKNNQTLSGIERENIVYENLSEANPPMNPTLEYLYIPEGVVRINDSLLKRYNGIKTLKSDGLKYIADNQFSNCDGLTLVKFNDSLINIGKLPFENCDNLTNVDIDENNPYCASDKTYGVIYAPVTGWDETSLDKPNYRIVEALEANPATSYVVPESIKDSRTVDEIDERAFQDRKAMKSFDSRYGNIRTIPQDCFLNDDAITMVFLGKSVKYIENGAFKNMGSHDADPKVETPKIRVYNETLDVSYKTSGEFFDHTHNKIDNPYYFYSVRGGDNGDTTYNMCDYDVNDNLIWKGSVTEDEPVDLKDCEIVIRENHSPKTLPIDGSAVVWEAGDPDNGDFYVRYMVSDGVYKTLKNGEDYSFTVLNNLTETGTKEFSIDSVSDKYTGTNKSSFEVISSSSGDKLKDFDIVFPKGDRIPYSGNPIALKALSDATSAEKSNYGEFYVINSKQPYNVLEEGKDYSFSPSQVKEKGQYTLTINGLRSYSGSSKPAEFEVVDGATPPGPTPTPTPGTLVLRKITYPETSDGDQTRLYANGREYVMSPGYDFIVFGSDDKVVDPGEYKVEVPSGSNYTTDGKNLIGVKGDPEKTIEIPFTVETPGNPSSNYAKSTIAGKFIIIPKEENDGDFNIKLPGIDDLGFAEWTGGVIEPEPVVYLKTDSSTILEVIKHYTVGYPDTDDDSGPNNKDMGTNKGVVYIYGANGTKYAGKSGRRYFSIRKSIPYYVTSDDNRKKITFTVTNGRYYTGEGEIKVDEDVDDSTTKKEEGKYSKGTVNADVVLTDATTGKKLVEGVDYTLSFKKEKGMNGTVTVTGMGNYFGSYTSAKFPLKKESKSSSSSSGGGSSSNSSSNKSSSSSSSRSSSSSMGGSSSSSGTGSSSGANRNSGTTVINRNYYGPNGGTVDELQDMLRAAHIDSINGGTADGYQVNITKSDAAEQAFRDALIRRYGSLDNIRYFSMDISVRDQNGNPIDTSGMSVTLTLPLPTSMQQYGTNNKIATVDSGGDLEDLNEQFSTLEGRPCVTFVAPHFSPYGFYVNTADLAIGTLDNTPKTGDPIHPKWFLSFGLAALSIFLFLKRDPKPRVSAA